MGKMISTKQAAKIAGVNIDTIRRWNFKGLIESVRTKGNHRRYDEDSLLAYMGKRTDLLDKVTLIYARVSTPNRKSDLENQVKVLELFCAAKGWKHTILTDIGSGLNYNKKGLLDLIKLIETNQVERIVLNYKDRLLRFGSEIIFELCKYHNVEVVIVNEDESRTYEEELVQDVLSVIAVFSAKLYGSRSHKNKFIVDNAKKIFGEKEQET